MPHPTPTWRPISEAPRDGTKILVAWDHTTQYSGHIDIMRWSYFGGGFTEKYMAGPLVRELKNQPTHFMPLPPPPETTP